MFFLASESGNQEVVTPSLAFTRCRHQPCSISPGRKEGYILHNALSSCVGRLRVFEKLQDLLQALLVWLPVHGARRTAGVGAWVSAGSLGFCVRPNLSPQGRRKRSPRRSRGLGSAPVQVRGPRQLSHPRPHTRGLESASGGNIKTGHQDRWRGRVGSTASLTWNPLPMAPPPPPVMGPTASASLESEGPAPAVF